MELFLFFSLASCLLLEVISVLEISENHKYSSVGQSLYPSFGLKIQGLFKDIFSIFQVLHALQNQ